MSTARGMLVLMGSGELTATMVEVHKKILERLPRPHNAVFLDTPAGFQLNVDEISRKAVEYFRVHVQKPLTVAAFKSAENITALEAETAYGVLRNARYVLVGPGSPTYAVRQLRKTPIPDILHSVIHSGGCLVAASAAALTMGRHTLPVYEIYKVGQKIHWVDGLDILAPFGFDLVVVPHWNNAEGGTHDTRFCYMGESRFRKLEALLPENTTILGIDEHTACIIDLEELRIDIQGIGDVTLRRMGREMKFGKGDSLPFETLAEAADMGEWTLQERDEIDGAVPTEAPEKTVLGRAIELEASFRKGLASQDQKVATNALLALDSIIWKAQRDMEDGESISQAREILRESIVLLGAELGPSPRRLREYVAPLVEPMLQLRVLFRKKRQWSDADSIRDILLQANIRVEDTEDGFHWRILDENL